MFDATIQVESEHLSRYNLTRNGDALSYSDVLLLWNSDTDFRTYFSHLLTTSPFAAFRWETPFLTRDNVLEPFEFVLINSPEFTSRKPDTDTFRKYFSDGEKDQGVVAFKNLRGDATLIVPSPRTVNDVYGHLAAFIRNAPETQVDAFWRVVGSTLESAISDAPIWLSTAGAGVAWLHVRIDSRPKYYNYKPYKTNRIFK